jgi:phage terminase small subunit
MDNQIKKHYERYKKHVSDFGNAGGLFEVDELALLKLSEWEKLYEDNRKICEETGYTQITQSGYSQIKAEYSIMVKAQEMIIKLGSLFGVTPADRAKILGGKTPPKKEKKGFDTGMKVNKSA